MKTDTLYTITKSIQQSSIDSVDFINKVDSFYNSAWLKLMIVGGLIFGVFGIIVPIIFQRSQNKALDLKEKEIKIDMKEELSKLKDEMREEFRKDYKAELKQLEEKTENKMCCIQGMGLHIQGISLFNSGDIEDGISGLLLALKDYIQGVDYLNFRTVSVFIIESGYKKITKKQLDDIFHKQGTTKEDFFKLLIGHKNYFHLRKEIIDLKYHSENLLDK